MGEGSFGQVFEGFLSTPVGNQRVVLKRVKTRVQGAEEMSQMEHLLNVYASRVARGHCADFLGYCEVADSEANSRLTSGLWLVWKYEGSKTLSYYLRRRDTVRALAADLEVPEGVVVQTVMRHIFEGLAAFHAAGLVHRDVKPLNMILAEDVRRFKLIDLGACADLRSGTNYVPEESILDLNFCPPEQFVMPTDSPHIAKQAGLFKLAISPMLWAKHKPDRFDTWSAGIVMLQLAVPAMRTDRALRNFNAAYGPKYKYDLAAWRKGIHLPVRDCVLLDADDGAGWELLQSLLAPRHIQVDDNGGVSFVNDTPFQRISAFEALKHRFIKGAVEAAAQSSPAVASSSGRSAAAAAAAAGGPSSRGSAAAADAAAAARKGNGNGKVKVSGETTSEGGGAGEAKSGSASDPLGSALGVWRDMTGRLFDLEARIMRQTSATELQTTTVKRLKEQVDSGKVDPALLQKEEKVLSRMQNRLAGLQQDFSSTASQASGIFSFFGFGGKQQQQAQQQSADPKAARGSMDKAQQNLQALRSAEAASSSAAAAASSAAASSSSAGAAPSAAGMFNSVWERLSSRLGELERKISNQASATERQSLVVRGLRAKVKAGEAEPEILDKAERTLSRMERRLLDLDRDYWAAKQNAKGALAGNMPTEGSGSGGKQRPGSREQSASGVSDAVAATQAARRSDSDSEAGGSFWSRLLGSRSGSSGSFSSMDGSTKEAAQPSTSAAPAAQQQSAAAAAAAAAPQPQRPPRSWSPMFRRSPSPTPAQQQAAAPPPPLQPQQQQPGSGYRSIFGAFGGLGSATSSTDQPPAASASTAPPAAPPPPPPPRTSSPLRFAPSRGGGGGGLFGGLFGRPSQQQQQQQPEPAAPAPQARAAASSASALSSSGLPVPPPAAPTSAPGGDALVEGASRVIRNSLSFTGLAAKIAGDMATAFKADAERYLKELELQEAAKRQQRTLDLAFLALLREAQPPVASSTSFEQAEERFAGEARWAALADVGRRRELFGKYLQAAKKVEEQTAAAADAAFRAALRRYNVSATSRWEDFRDSLTESDPAVAGVQDAGRRQQLFLEVVAELQLQAALQAASLQAEMQFTRLLAELRDPPVTSTSTWALVRRAVAADPRCQALPERRRRELFETYTARLFEEESRRSEAAAAAAQAAAELEAAAELPPAAAAAAAAVAVPAVAVAAAAAAPAETPQVAAVPAPPAAEPLPVVPPVVAVIAVRPDTTAQTESVPGAATSDPAATQVAAAPAAADAGSASAAALEDDDLSAALAGMEAALESAIKAVASAPLPTSFGLGASGMSGVSGSGAGGVGVGVGVGGGNNVVSIPPAQFHAAGAGAGPINGVAAKKPATPASPGGAAAAAAASEGIRLEELRREQARLRAEYEAMAQRLREMEERLKSQAQLMSDPSETEAEAEGDGQDRQDGAVLRRLPRGGGGGGDGELGGGINHSNGTGLAHSGSDDAVATVRGSQRRW